MLGVEMKISGLKKSFHVQINEKMAVVARAGMISGTMIDEKIRKCPQPSIDAASSSSLGIVRMNCMIKNTKNASTPKNFGTISGR